MVEFEASEAESALAVQLSALTTYIMNMAASYKKEMLRAKELVEKLIKENKQLKEKLNPPKKQDPIPQLSTGAETVKMS